MKLFLSGGGSEKESFNLDKKFIENIDQNKPVLYIPIAINTIKHPYSDCLDWLKGNFKPFNFDNFIMWTEEDLQNKTEKDFEQFGGIYIGGGNTFKLLYDLKQLGTFEILKSLANKNVPIYGGSAGAIVLTHSILACSYLDKNEINLTDLNALDLVNVDIWCHYVDSMKQDLKDFMYKHSLAKIIAIPQDAGLFVNEKGIEVVGPNKITVFSNGKETEYLEGQLL